MEHEPLLRYDEGTQFGLGVFETIAIHDGRPALFDVHMRRLARGLRFLGLHDIRSGDDAVRRLVRSDGDDWEPMARRVRRAIVESNAAHGDLALKITVSEANLAFTFRANPYATRDPEQAMRLVLGDIRRNETSPLTRHKTLNQGDNILATRAAKLRGYDGALLLNTRGEVAETTVANIFLVRHGHGAEPIRVVTPPVSCGLLPGTVREWAIARLAAYGTAVEETRLTPNDLADYDECFITNALMGVWSVASIGELTFPVHTTARMLRRDVAALIVGAQSCSSSAEGER